jgi:hypothetical protein
MILKTNFIAKPALVLFLAVGLFSCKKEPGCTDPNAVNYEASAEENDGSCTFEGEIVLWYGEDASEFLVNDGATTLTFYVNDEIVGSTAANIFWTSAPNCGSNASITVTKSLGTATNQSYEYSVVDQTGWEYWSGVINFSANTCLNTELTL